MSRKELQVDRDISTIPLQMFKNQEDDFFEDVLNEVYRGNKSDEFIKGLFSGYYTSQLLVEQGQKEMIFHILCFLSKKINN